MENVNPESNPAVSSDAQNEQTIPSDVQNDSAVSPDSQSGTEIPAGESGGQTAAAETKSSPAKEVLAKIFSVLQKIFAPKTFSVWFPILIIAAVFLIVGYYLIFPSRGYFHSDCTDTLVWAAASYESGHIFDPDTNYACLLPFGGSLLMLPFYGVFGFSMTTHLIGMSLFMILFSAALIFMLKQMKWSLPWIAVMYSAVMLTVSVSEKLREIFWGHTIYYSLGILFIFVGLYLYFKLCNMKKKNQLSENPHAKRNYIILMAVIFVWFFLCATDKLMAVTIFSLPVIGAVFLERFLDFDKKVKDNRFYGIVLAVTIIATVAGYMVSTAVAGDIVGGYADAYSNFSAPDSWVENFHKFPVAWLTLLGVNIHDRDPIMQLDSILNLVKIVAALLLIVIPVIAACVYPKIKDRFTRVIIIVHFIVTALVMMGYVFGMLSAANWRLSPIVCTSVLATVAFAKWIYDNKPIKRLGGLLVVPQICVCLIVALEIYQMPHDYGQDERLYAIADFLEENDLDYGYATFWNANAITVISNDKVKVRCINDISSESSYIGMNLYQSRKPWYDPEPDQDKFFLVVSSWEYSQLAEAGNPVIYMEHEELYCNDYTVLVFDENIL